MRNQLGALLTGSLLACGGGGNSGSATSSGTVDGIVFSPNQAVFAFGEFGDGTQSLGILLSNRSDLCSAAQHFDHFKNLTALELSLENPDAGTFPVSPNGTASANFASFGPTCLSNAGSQAASGTLTLNPYTSQTRTVTGSFSLSFETAGNLVGTFSATTCDAPDGGFTRETSADGGPSCG